MLFGALILVIGILAFSRVSAGDLPTRDEVLQSVYPGALIRSEKVFLTEEQMQTASKIAGTELESKLVASYIARKEGKVIGSAFIDTHIVRTKKQSLIVCLDSEGKVLRIEATAFFEPPEYLASEPFLDQYEGEAISQELFLGRKIRPIAGATLTVQSVNQAVRRVLALNQVINGNKEHSSSRVSNQTIGTKPR
jgi:hypothetical protein